MNWHFVEFLRLPFYQRVTGIWVLLALCSLGNANNADAASWMHANGPYGGPIKSLASYPSSAGTLYAAIVGQGLFKTKDGGKNWEIIASTGNGINDTTEQYQAITIDPNNPSIVYIAIRGGIYKSIDGGNSWSGGGGFGSSFEITALAVAPYDSNTLFANAHQFYNGYDIFYKSTDGGSTWHTSYNGLGNVGNSSAEVNSLVFDPSSPGVIYVGGKGIYKSNDNGATWFSSGAGVVGNVHSIIIDKNSPSTLYAAAGSGIFKSVDAGLTWQSINTGLDVLLAQSGSVPTVAIDPNNSSVLYLADNTAGIYKSVDAGASWQLQYSHATINSLIVDPSDSSTIYAASYVGGLYKSVDGGTDWKKADLGLGFANTSSIVINPSNPSIVYASTNGGDVYRSVNGGVDWQWESNGLAHTAWSSHLAIDPIDPTNVYLGSDNNVYKSVDSGANWQQISTGLDSVQVSGVVVDHNNPSTLYIGTNKGVYKTTNSGASWVSSNSGVSYGTRTLDESITNPNIIFQSTASGIYKTIDASSTWQRVNSNYAARDVYAIAIDPNNSSIVYASGYDSYYGYGVVNVTTDGGQSWSETKGIFFDSLAIDPTNTSTIYGGYGGGYSGIYQSTDGGVTWQGTLGAKANALVVSPTGTVYAGTTQGVYIYGQLPPTNPDVDGDGIPNSYEILNGLNPLDPSDATLDFDGDGLSNYQEYELGTDPNSLDTDHDGVSDGDEVTDNTDPNNANHFNKERLKPLINKFVALSDYVALSLSPPSLAALNAVSMFHVLVSDKSGLVLQTDIKPEVDKATEPLIAGLATGVSYNIQVTMENNSGGSGDPQAVSVTPTGPSGYAVNWMKNIGSPIVLVHGWNSTGDTWKTVYTQFKDLGGRIETNKLDANGAESDVAEADVYVPTFTNDNNDNPCYQSVELGRYLQQIYNATGKRSTVVGHSQGGIVGRLYLQAGSRPDYFAGDMGKTGTGEEVESSACINYFNDVGSFYGGNINELITYGTPHNGATGLGVLNALYNNKNRFLKTLNDFTNYPIPDWVKIINIIGFSGVGILGDSSSDCVVSASSQDMSNLAGFDSTSKYWKFSQNERVHHGKLDCISHPLQLFGALTSTPETSDFNSVAEALHDSTLQFLLGSPADLMVISPSGKIIGKSTTSIWGASYNNVADDKGIHHNSVEIPFPEDGVYTVKVIPFSDASPDDTFSLTASLNGQTVTLAKSMKIKDIPSNNFGAYVSNAGPTFIEANILPDLVVDNITASSIEPILGESVSIAAMVKNIGTKAATNFAIDLYNNHGAYEPVLGEKGYTTCTVSSLAPNDTTMCSGSVKYSTVGTYTVWAQADTLGAITELNETNNLAKQLIIVTYKFGGFLSPLLNDGTYKLGRTLPLKFQLFDANGTPVSTAHATLAVYQLDNSEVVGDPLDVASTSSADTGNTFRYSDDKYIYNLSTSALSQGTYRLVVSLDDGTTHSIDISLK